MNEQEKILAELRNIIANNQHYTTWTVSTPHLVALVNKFVQDEREAWEQKLARLQHLMDVREIQPNKPCCLAARADERKAIMKSIEELRPVEDNPLLQNKPAAFWIENFRQIVYTRGEA